MRIISIHDQSVIKTAVELLSKGGLIIFPTETAYGVGVDATNELAVTKLLEYKKRPQGKAISIGVSDATMSDQYVARNDTAKHMYTEFLPGPVTVISRSKGTVDARLESENGTLGIRIPEQPTILEIIKTFDKPITTTSANSAGKKTPYSIDDVFETLNSRQMQLIELVIDGGQLPRRLTSTVIDTTTDELKTYRKGSIVFERKEIVTEFTTCSAEETIALGTKIMQQNIEQLQDHAVLFLLHGELGAGKTHFTKGIAQALGITRTIKSPTYTYVEEYPIQKYHLSSSPPTEEGGSTISSPSNGVLYHIDAWKVETKEDLELLGFEKWMKLGNVLVIEWPEIIENLQGDFGQFVDSKIIELDFQQGTEADRRVISVIK